MQALHGCKLRVGASAVWAQQRRDRGLGLHALRRALPHVRLAQQRRMLQQAQKFHERQLRRRRGELLVEDGLQPLGLLVGVAIDGAALEQLAFRLLGGQCGDRQAIIAKWGGAELEYAWGEHASLCERLAMDQIRKNNKEI